jgi:DNA-binding LacI/PurR family transcriptional regulator
VVLLELAKISNLFKKHYSWVIMMKRFITRDYINRVVTSTMITLADVAQKAGVARSTVSHVLSERNGDNVRIPDATRDRILEAAHELGYRPNTLARSVRSGKSNMIGYLVNDPSYEPYWNTVVGALDEAEKVGFTLKMLSVTQETLAERIQQCIGLRLSGLIVRMSQDKSSLFEEASAAGMPVVLVDEMSPHLSGIRVAADDTRGFEAAISHLIELGHRRIGFIADGFYRPRGTERFSVREALFRQAMAARGMQVPEGFVTYESMSVYGSKAEPDMDVSTVLAAVDSLLGHPEGRPTAIMCWRDETAIVAMRACREHGLRVPEDISIVGFSDIRSARFCDPPLSTCKSPWNEMGRTAVRQLVRVLGAEFDPSPQTFLLASGFVARQSSGPAPV